MRVAIIPADDTLPIRITEIENTLAAKQKIVDGLIEVGRLEDNELGSVAMDLYWNEEFLYREDFEFNGRASALYLLSFPLFEEPVKIFGDVIAIGGIDKAGNDVGLTDAQVAQIQKCFMEVEIDE
jgi:hypothetical protein